MTTVTHDHIAELANVDKATGASNFAFSCIMSAMNPSSASLLRIPALLLYKDELLGHKEERTDPHRVAPVSHLWDPSHI
jgi:hypothetical protein